METNEILVVSMLASFVALVFSGFPIAWLLGGLAVAYSVIAILGFEHLGWDTFFLTDWRIFGTFVQRIYAQMSNWVMVALPMFIFMGLMLERSGVAERLMTSFTRLFGAMRGGLAFGVVNIGVLLAASTGIVGASVVLLAIMSVPIMLAQQYDRGFAAGTAAAAGTLGILIPPSIMLIIMADQMSMSVGRLFMGALIPGLLLGGLYLGYVLLAAAVKPSLAPAPRAEDRPAFTWWIVFDTVKAMVPPLLLVLAVLGSIFFGIATPTEASGVGALGATLLAYLNGRLSFDVLRQVSERTMLTTAFIVAIFLGATTYAVVLRSLGGDDFIGDLLTGIPLGPEGVILVILLIVFLCGFFLDWLEITLIVLPLVAPVVVGLGFDPVWFVVLFAVTLQTSFLTPPVGFSLFYLKGVVPASIRTRDIYRGVIPFVLLQILAVALVFNFPDLVLWLPDRTY